MIKILNTSQVRNTCLTNLSIVAKYPSCCLVLPLRLLNDLSNFDLQTNKTFTMQKITLFLWINANLEEVMDYYTSIFKDSKIISSHKMGDGSFMTASIELEGQQLMFLNGGQFELNDSFSLFVRCETQQEVDYYWENLTVNGGAESMCGWLKDKYGLSWQIIPNALMELMSAGGEGSQSVMQAMMQMRKIEIAKLEEAYNAV